MPYSLTLPNGIVVNNIPDNVTRGQALENLKAKMPDAFPAPPGIGEQLLGLPAEIGKGFVRGLTVDPASGLASLGYTGARAAGADLVPFEQTGVGKGLAGFQRALAPSDEGLITQFGSGLGSLLSFIPGGLLKGGIGLATKFTQAGGVGSEEARARAEEARVLGEADATAGQQFLSQLGGTGVGFSELMPLKFLTGPIEQILRGVPKSQADIIAPTLFNSGKRMLVTGGIEGFQEGMANIAQDLIAKGIYNPNLEVGESALGDAAMGASVGAFAQGAIDLATRGKRRQLYEQVKQQEEFAKQAEEQRIAAEQQAALAAQERQQQQLAMQALGGPRIDPETGQPILLLGGPAPEVNLQDPLGVRFGEEDLGPKIVSGINRARKAKGLPPTKEFTIEDLYEAGTEKDAPFISEMLARKIGFDPAVQVSPDSVIDLALSKNIDVESPGFADFLRRTTGSPDIGAMSAPQLFAAQQSLSALPNFTEPTQLPTGSGATVFDEKTYKKTVDGLKKTVLNSGPLGRSQVLEEVKGFSGLTETRDAERLLETALRRGDLSASPTQGLVGTSINISLPSAPGVAGPDIRRGDYMDSEVTGYEVTSEDGKFKQVRPNLTAAENAAAAANEKRLNAVEKLNDELNRTQLVLDSNQEKLTELEEVGNQNTPQYKKIDSNVKNLTNKINRLNEKIQSASQPLQVKAKQTPRSRAGFTLFENGQPVGTYPTQEDAEIAAVRFRTDEELDGIINAAPRTEREGALEQPFGEQPVQRRTVRGGMPRRLVDEAIKEKERRYRTEAGLPPPAAPVKIKITGDAVAAAERLRAAGLTVRFAPEVEKEIPEINKKLRAVLDRLGLKEVRLNVVESMKVPGFAIYDQTGKLRAFLKKVAPGSREYQQTMETVEQARSQGMRVEESVASGNGSYAAKLIEIALDSKNPILAARHEAIHALKELGFFTPEQWRVLENKAKSEWIELYNIKSRYSDLDAEGQLEEAIADAFSFFELNQPPVGTVGTLFRKVKAFFEALGNAFRGSGFQTARDVFTRVEEGRLTGPGAAVTGEQKTRYSVPRLSSDELDELSSDPRPAAAFDNSRIVNQYNAWADAFEPLPTEIKNKLDAYYIATRRADQTAQDPGYSDKGARAAETRTFKAAINALENHFGRELTGDELTLYLTDWRGKIDKRLEKPVSLDRTRYSLANLQEYVTPEAAEGILRRRAARPEGFGAPINNRVVIGKGDDVFAVGKITPIDWKKRVEGTMTEDEVIDARNWYQQLRDVFEPLFGPKASEYSLAWLLSQQRASPTKGFTDVLRASDIAQNKLRIKKAGLNEKALVSALRGEVPEGGIGSKLLDFIDSEMGRTTRTVVRGAPEGRQPAAIDVWAQRDIGFVDDVIKKFVAKKYGKEAADKLEIDTARFGEPQYEYGVDFYNDVAEYLNQQNYLGGNWTASEVQAVGWVNMQKFVGVQPEFVRDIIGGNTRRISLGLAPGAGGPMVRRLMGKEIPVSEAKKVIEDIAKLSNVKVIQSVDGVGAYLTYVEGSIQLDAIGSPESVEDFMDMIGYVFQQTEMISTRPLKSGKNSAIDIVSPSLNTQDKAIKFFTEYLNAMPKDSGGDPIAPGFQQIKVDGVPGIRLINFGGKWNKKQIEELAKAAEVAEKATGIKDAVFTDMNVQFTSTKNDWVKYPDGDQYVNSLRNRGRLQETQLLQREFPPARFDLAGDGTINWRPRLKYEPKLSLGLDELVGGPGIGSGISIREQQPTAQSFDAVHYGKQRVNTLLGSMYGTGIKGAEARRVFASEDPRIQKRAYFYIPMTNGRMPMPEAGLGNQVHVQRLNNLLGPSPEMQALVNATRGPDGRMDENAFESAVIDAGYDGYAVPDMGMAVVLGADVPVIARPQEVEKDKIQIGDRKYSLRPIETPEFKQWFGSSQIVNADSTPKVMYHGTARDIGTFVPKQANAIFLTDSPKFAEGFTSSSEDFMVPELFASLSRKEQFDVQREAEEIVEREGGDLQDEINTILKNRLPSRANIMPLYVRAENPFDYENPDHLQKLVKQNSDIGSALGKIRNGSWSEIESERTQKAIIDAGFDSFYVREGGRKNLAVYNPNQVKSAIGNIGTFSRDNDDIRYSIALGSLDPRTALIPDVGGNPDGSLGLAPEKVGFKPIRMLIGTHNDIEDKGFGANHILTRVLSDPNRMAELDMSAKEVLERIVRTAQKTAQNYSRIYRDPKTKHLAFYTPNNTLIVSQDRDQWSIVSMFKVDRPDQKFGQPIWQGRAPALQQFVGKITGTDVEAREGRIQPKAKTEVTVKPKRVYTPSEIEEIAEPKKGTLTLGRKLSLSLPTTKEFKNWSGNSPIVSADKALDYDFKTGEPFVAQSFHGTNTESDFIAFDIKKGGLQTGAESARMGIFSTSDPSVASNYASNLGMGRYLKLLMQGVPELVNDQTILKINKREEQLQSEKSSVLNDGRKAATKKIEEEFSRQGIKEDDRFPIKTIVKSAIQSFDSMESLLEYAGSDYLDQYNKINAELDELKNQKTEFIFDHEAMKIPQRILPVFVRMKNPKVYDAEGKNPGEFPISDRIAEAKKEGHDGVVFRNIADPSPVAVHYVTFKPDSDIKSAIGNVGTYGQRAPTVEEAQRFGMTPEEALASQQSGDIRYSLAIPSEIEPSGGRDNMIYLLQDKNIDLKRVQQGIVKAGKDILDRFNAYMKEELFHGRSATRVRFFMDRELRPLLQKMEAAGISVEQMDDYLLARHAKEANAYIRKINPDPKQNSGMTDKEADDYMASLPPPRRAALEKLAKEIDGITKGTRQLMVDYGLEDQKTINQWEKTYKNYVPLFREEIEGDEETQSYMPISIGRGYQIRGSTIKRRMGSARKVSDILANIALQRERIIVRGEKNRVGNALYGLVLDNPDKDFWAVINPEKMSKQAMRIELLNLGINPDAVDDMVNRPIKKKINPTTGLVSYEVPPMWKNAPNLFITRINGEDRIIGFNKSNERSMRMAATLKNLDAQQQGEAVRMMGTAGDYYRKSIEGAGKVTRYFAQINTQYNPAFGVYNLLRDIGGAVLNLQTTPLKGQEAKVVSDALVALKSVYRDLRRQRQGLDADSKWAQIFEEFELEGGKTGYRDLFETRESRAEALQQEIQDFNKGNLRSKGKAIMGWLSDFNDSIENAIRVSVYKNALDKGLSKERAASLAKNITVNFNRTGAVSRNFQTLFAFFNASIQGTARIAQTLLTSEGKLSPTGKKIVMGGITLGLLQAVLLAMAGLDDDEVPDFVKDKSFVIPYGDGKYFAIPMPLGYNIIPGFGRRVMEFAMSDDKNVGKAVAETSGMIIDGFNPLGSATFVQTLTPTALDPLVALAENKDFTGKPISREDVNSLNPTPGYTRGSQNAFAITEALAYGINLLTGGTEFKKGVLSPTPDQIEYLVGEALGGVGREAMKIGRGVEALATGEELATYNIPIAGRLVGNVQQQAAQRSRFFENVRTLNEHQAEIEGRLLKGEDISEYIDQYPEASLYQVGDKIYNRINKLRQMRKVLEGSGADREQLKTVDEAILGLMTSLNEIYSSAKAQ